ncbi:MAG: hypothetical protein WCK02_10355 [Bacteroidota bacterium]
MAKSRHLILTLFCLTFFSFSYSQSNTDTVKINYTDTNSIYLSNSICCFPEINIQITPPQYFSKLPNNAIGFIHNPTASSIQIAEIKNTAYFMVIKGLDSAYFRSQNLDFLNRKDVVTNDGKKGVLYLVKFKVEGVEFERIMIFTGDYNRTIWLNANFPAMGHETLYEVLLSSLLTIKF